jgi:RNA polymerase sigma-54 factor
VKQTLSLKLGQQLTMTPQLQQAIRLLQLSSLDLQQEVQEVLEVNPMLEVDEDEPLADGNAETSEPDADAGELPVADSDNPVSAAETGAEAADADADSESLRDTDAEWEQPIPEDLPVDTSWDDVYESAPAPAAPAADEDWNFDDSRSAGETLQDHLLWQLNLTPMSRIDQLIATAIIDAIDNDGMLTVSIADLLASLNPLPAGADDEVGIDPAYVIEEDEILAVLKRIQQFDPTGIAARDLPECLALQLTALGPETPWKPQALELVTSYLDLLAARDFTALKRKTRLSEDDLAKVVTLIQSLNPRPGASIASEMPDYVIPDVLVHRNNGRWVVELNPEATPKLRINSAYAGLVKRADSSADNTYLKDNLQDARWFLKSLQSRNDTLLKVATRIVEHQRGFLEYGEEAMKPLVLHDIAEAVEMHESTISRVTSRKYMHTPRGIFELKYFFSSHVSTNTGGEVSSTAIRALIKKLTADENPRKPLSDNKIAAILAEQNIKVARRTVAKYRESLAIPPSNERKRLV